MKILAQDLKTNRALAFVNIRIIIKDKDSGFLRVRTDEKGYFELDDIYRGEKIGGTVTNVPGLWTIAHDEAVLSIEYEQIQIPDKTES